MTIATDAIDALTGAASGASMGAALGPIGAGVGGAIGLAMKLVPDLAKAIGGDTAGAVATKVAQTVQDVTGTAHPGAQAAALADPQVEADLRVSLGQIAADHDRDLADARNEALKATLADVAGARATNLELAKSGNWTAAVEGVVIDAFILALFAGCVLILMLRVLPDAGPSRDLLVGLIGTVSALAVTVVQYHRGSSAGSAAKSKELERQSVSRSANG